MKCRYTIYSEQNARDQQLKKAVWELINGHADQAIKLVRENHRLFNQWIECYIFDNEVIKNLKSNAIVSSDKNGYRLNLEKIQTLGNIHHCQEEVLCLMDNLSSCENSERLNFETTQALGKIGIGEKQLLSMLDVISLNKDRGQLDLKTIKALAKAGGLDDEDIEQLIIARAPMYLCGGCSLM